MQIVQRECGRYFDSYAKCVNKFPDTWHLDCNKQKVKLARCAETEPTIMKIKTDCAAEFEKYEACVTQHPTDSSRCTKEFQSFNDCVERVTPAIDQGNS